jgi:hypothetical protein
LHTKRGFTRATTLVRKLVRASLRFRDTDLLPVDAVGDDAPVAVGEPQVDGGGVHPGVPEM